MTIRRASEVREGTLLILGLAEDSDGGGRSLILQVDAREPETHCLSTSDGATAYDVLSGWDAAGHTLILRLRPDAASTLGIPAELHLLLDPELVSVDAVQRAMSSFANRFPGPT